MSRSQITICTTEMWHLQQDVLRERKPPPRQLHYRGDTWWRPLASQRISYYHGVSGVKESGRVILDHVRIRINTLLVPRSVNAHRMTDKQYRSHNLHLGGSDNTRDVRNRLFYFGSVFEKKTWIRFGMSLVRFGTKNAVQLGHYSYLLLMM